MSDVHVLINKVDNIHYYIEFLNIQYYLIDLPITNHTPYQGDNSQHTLRKDLTDIIHIKTSCCTKDTGHTQSTQGYSHIKTPLEDHSR